MDGRDTPKTAAASTEQIQEVESKLAPFKEDLLEWTETDAGKKLKLAMKPSLAKFLFVKRAPLDYLKSEYENDRFDEFITPALFSEESAIKEGDCIFFFNF